MPPLCPDPRILAVGAYLWVAAPFQPDAANELQFVPIQLIARTQFGSRTHARHRLGVRAAHERVGIVLEIHRYGEGIDPAALGMGCRGDSEERQHDEP